MNPSLRKVLRGDLDTIVLKALQKKPGDRYATVNALGDDLERYLSGRPVLARPDSAWYRLSKFVRRNALAVGAATAVIVSLAVSASSPTRQARVLAEQRRIAQTERDTAEQVVRLLIDLFETTNPSVRPDGERMPIGEFLAGAEDALARAPALDAGRAREGCSRSSVSSIRREGSTPRRVRRSTKPLPNNAASAGRIIPSRSNRCRRSASSPACSMTATGHVRFSRNRSNGTGASTESRHERTARVLHALAPIVATRDREEGGRLLMRALEIRRATLRAQRSRCSQRT